VSARAGEQLLVTVEALGDGAEVEGHAAADQFGRDLGDAAVLGLSPVADPGDDIETELMLGEGVAALLLGAQGDAAARGSGACDSVGPGAAAGPCRAGW
jgi:hypothetical protein